MEPGGLIIGMMVGVFLGLMFAVDSRIDRRRWRESIEKHRKQVLFRALHDTDACAMLAEKLDIEADGGEAADFVRQMVEECWRETDAL